MAMTPFLWGDRGEQLTPQQVERRRIAALLASQRASDTSPVGHWTQAAARGLSGFMAGRGERFADEQENAGLAGADERIQSNPVLSALMGGQQMAAPVPPGMAPAQPMAPGEARSAPGADAIRAGLVQRGLPGHVADAFVMNFQDESGLNPGIEEQVANVHGTKGFGLAQWTGPRRDALTQFAQSQGRPVSDVDTQLDFLMTELQGPESRAAQAILGAQDTGGAASAIVNQFLRPAEEHRARREAAYTGGAGSVPQGMATNTPQAPSGVVAALAAAQSDPWVAQKYGPVINALMEQEMGRQNASYEQQMRQTDPMYQAQLQAAQIANQQAMMPQAPELINAGGGNLYDPASGQWVIAPRGPQEPMSGLGKLEADRAAGLISDEAYAAELAGMAPQGMSIESDGAGGFRMVQGAGAGDSRPFTEGQSKDNVYVTRAEGALSVLDPIATNLTSRADLAAEMVPFGMARGMQSDEFQMAKNAGDEFLQAILRKDTGAAITPDEQSLYGVTYLPQPGDSEAVQQQKVMARRRAVEAIKSGQSPSQLLAVERALQASGSQQLQPVGGAPAAAATTPEAPVRDFRAMDPAMLSTVDINSLSDAELDAYLEATQ